MKRKPKGKRIYRYVYRSSVTGLFVSGAFAAKNPDTTQRQRVRISRPCK